MMKELINKIEDWGKKNKIDTCDSLLQTTKTLEEITELQRAIIMCEKHRLKSNSCIPKFHVNALYYKEDIKDAIGDIFITLVMLSMQLKLEFIFDEVEYNMSHEAGAYNNFELMNTVLEHIFWLQYDVIDESLHDYVVKYSGNITSLLSILSKRYDLTLEECVEHAYNEIKDRKGKIVDGLFMKGEQ